MSKYTFRQELYDRGDEMYIRCISSKHDFVGDDEVSCRSFAIGTPRKGSHVHITASNMHGLGPTGKRNSYTTKD